jgi:hypothetical protein
MTLTHRSKTRAVAVATALAMLGALGIGVAATASAVGTPSTVKASQVPTTADGFNSYGECPEPVGQDLDDLDGWHFVANPGQATFASLTAYFDTDGVFSVDETTGAVTGANITITLDDAIQFPTDKHAYVYTPAAAGATLIWAEGDLIGGTFFVLSHTCPGDGGEEPPLSLPRVSKTAETSYTKTYDWDVAKSVDDSYVTSIDYTHTANYEVVVTKSGPVLSDFVVSGEIEIANPNDTETLTITNVTDSLHEDGDALCEPDPLFVVSFDLAPGASTSVDYTCTFPDSTSPTATGTNSAVVSSRVGDEVLPNSVSNDAIWDFAEATVDTFNETADLDDSVYGDLGTFSASDTVEYSVELDVPSKGCVTYPNIATLTFETGSATSSASVKVCRPNNTGGYTIGYWQNKNGQAFVKNNAAAVKAAIDARYNKSTAPLLPAPAGSTQLAKWVYDTVKAPVSGAPIAMFDKQYLATVLSTVKSPDLLDTCIVLDPVAHPDPISVEDFLLAVKADYEDLVADPTHREGIKNTFDRLNNNAQPVYACS